MKISIAVPELESTSASGMTAKAGGRDQKWFDGLSKKAQKEYLAARPRSKFHKSKPGAKKATVVRGGVVSKAVKVPAVKITKKQREAVNKPLVAAHKAQQKLTALEKKARSEVDKANKAATAKDKAKALREHPLQPKIKKASTEVKAAMREAHKAAEAAVPAPEARQGEHAVKAHKAQAQGIVRRLMNRLLGKK